MRSTLDELKSELADLQAFVASIKPVNDALRGHTDSVVGRYVSIRRRFDDAAFAVALYASFEKFVESLIIAYARLEAARVEYAELPEALTKKHLVGTADLLKRQLGEGRYAGMTTRDVAKNLFDCLSGARPYALNEVVVRGHDQNLRAPEVNALFAVVGIDNICDLARRAHAMKSWHRRLQGLAAQTEGAESPAAADMSPTVIEERLKDIVMRRNEVSHHGGNPTNLLGADAMSEAVSFIESLAVSIFDLVAGRYLRHPRANGPSRIDLRLREGPYKDGTVVVVDKPAERLFVEQPVFVTLVSTEARWGRIRSLRLNDVGVREVEGSASAAGTVGIGLDFACPTSATALVALTDDDDVLWSPQTLAEPAM